MAGEDAVAAAKELEERNLKVGSLVVPVMSDAGKIQSLQFIWPDGRKRFLKDGRAGGGYCPIGKADGTLCIVEGFATGATIHEVTGYAVAVAFNAGNLLPVAQKMRARFPGIRLIICADDDTHLPDNPGMARAREAVGATVAIPDLGRTGPMAQATPMILPLPLGPMLYGIFFQG